MTNILYDALFAGRRNLTRPFLILDDGSELNFRDFLHLSDQIADDLQEKGLQPGDRILVQTPKTAQSVALYAAALKIGAVYVPLNTDYTPKEVDYFVTNAEPHIFVCTENRLQELGELSDLQTLTCLTLNPDGSGSLMESASSHKGITPVAARSAEDIAAILYTSGTTGKPKGAMLTHENLLSNARTLVNTWEMGESDVLVHALPIFHSHGLFVALHTALLCGMRVQFLSAFDVPKILDALPKATVMMGVPTFYTRLLAAPEFNADFTQNMRLFISGSAPLLAETHQLFEQRTGHRILERYGMTETNMNTSNPYRGERRAGTVGPPLENVEIRITQEQTGEPLEPGETGMVEIRGPNVFCGYWRMPDKTREEFRTDSFFISGDLGAFDKDGYLRLVGRAKDLIISGGYNIYPKEIEDVLNEVEGIAESAVFGVPHSDFGEQVIAAIVTESGEPADESALQRAVERKLARFKHPKKYLYLDSLPRNTMGKVQKNILRSNWAE